MNSKLIHILRLMMQYFHQHKCDYSLESLGNNCPDDNPHPLDAPLTPRDQQNCCKWKIFDRFIRGDQDKWPSSESSFIINLHIDQQWFQSLLLTVYCFEVWQTVSSTLIFYCILFTKYELNHWYLLYIVFIFDQLWALSLLFKVWYFDFWPTMSSCKLL